MNPFERVVVYVKKDMYLRFRGLLLSMEGKTVSQWFREQIAKYIDDKDRI